MTEPQKITDRISISAYNDSAELTRKMIKWATSPDSSNSETLNIRANCNLESEAVSALLGSNKKPRCRISRFLDILTIEMILARNEQL